jgi:beta-hydroxylase
VRRSWRDRQAMMLNETCVHEAFSGADTTRLILFCDVERPVAPPMLALNRLMVRNVMKLLVTQNLPGEAVGAINRLYHRVWGLIAASSGLKARNRSLCYLVKNALVFGVLALFIAARA